MDHDLGRYEEHDDDGKLSLVVSTISIKDSLFPYETAVSHPYYNKGNWIVVENYEDEEQARKGHNSWIGIMTSEELPSELKEISEAGIIRLIREEFGEKKFNKHFTYKKKEKRG